MRILYVTNCTFDQSLMARKCGRKEATISPTINWAKRNDIRLIPMQCTEYIRHGRDRVQLGWAVYSKDAAFIKAAEDVADDVVQSMKDQVTAGHEIIGIVGIQKSPSCSFMRDNKSVYHPYGIFAAALEWRLKALGMEIPTVTIDVKSSAAAIENHLNKLVGQTGDLFGE